MRNLPQAIDRYQILELLGRGGMGSVYRAYDPELKREVALKLLAAGGSPVAQQRFATEIEAMIRLKHPNVAPIHTAGHTNGRPFLVMELIEGETLQDRLLRGPLESKVAANLALQLAEALEAAHRIGVLHRDLKPDNVLLRDKDPRRPVLVDFGLAKDLSSSEVGPTRSGTFLGTPGYWAPEQARGVRAEIGPPTDVYGVGGVLYACLTGEPPFTGGSLLELVVQAEQVAPAPPSSRNPEVDPALEAVCMRCLAKRCDDRYATAEDLARDLRRFLQGELRAPRRVGKLIPTFGLVLAVGAVATVAIDSARSSLHASPTPSKDHADSADPVDEDGSAGDGAAHVGALPASLTEIVARKLKRQDVLDGVRGLSHSRTLRFLERWASYARLPELSSTELCDRGLSERGPGIRSALWLYVAAKRGDRRGFDELASAVMSRELKGRVQDPALGEQMLLHLIANGHEQVLYVLADQYRAAGRQDLAGAAWVCGKAAGDVRCTYWLKQAKFAIPSQKRAWRRLRERASVLTNLVREGTGAELGIERPSVEEAAERTRWLMADLAPRSWALSLLLERSRRRYEPFGAADELIPAGEAFAKRGAEEFARYRYADACLRGQVVGLKRLANYVDRPAAEVLLHHAIELGEHSAVEVLAGIDPENAAAYLLMRQTNDFKPVWALGRKARRAAGFPDLERGGLPELPALPERFVDLPLKGTPRPQTVDLLAEALRHSPSLQRINLDAARLRAGSDMDANHHLASLTDRRAVLAWLWVSLMEGHAGADELRRFAKELCNGPGSDRRVITWLLQSGIGQGMGGLVTKLPRMLSYLSGTPSLATDEGLCKRMKDAIEAARAGKPAGAVDTAWARVRELVAEARALTADATPNDERPELQGVLRNDHLRRRIEELAWRFDVVRSALERARGARLHRRESKALLAEAKREAELEDYEGARDRYLACCLYRGTTSTTQEAAVLLAKSLARESPAAARVLLTECVVLGGRGAIASVLEPLRPLDRGFATELQKLQKENTPAGWASFWGMREQVLREAGISHSARTRRGTQ